MAGKGGISYATEDMNEMYKFVNEDLLLHGWWETVIKKYLYNIKVICFDSHLSEYEDFYDSVEKYFGSEFIVGICKIMDDWGYTNCGLFRYAKFEEGLDQYALEYVVNGEAKIRGSVKSELNINKIVTTYKSSKTSAPDDNEILLQLSTAEKLLGTELLGLVDTKIKECNEHISRNRLYKSIMFLLEALKNYTTGFCDGASALKDFEIKVYNRRKAAGANITVPVRKPTKIKLRIKP